MLDPESGASHPGVPDVPYGGEMDLQDPWEDMGSSGGECSYLSIQDDGHLQDARFHPQRCPVRSASDNRLISRRQRGIRSPIR